MSDELNSPNTSPLEQEQEETISYDSRLDIEMKDIFVHNDNILQRVRDQRENMHKIENNLNERNTILEIENGRIINDIISASTSDANVLDDVDPRIKESNLESLKAQLVSTSRERDAILNELNIISECRNREDEDLKQRNILIVKRLDDLRDMNTKLKERLKSENIDITSASSKSDSELEGKDNSVELAHIKRSIRGNAFSGTKNTLDKNLQKVSKDRSYDQDNQTTSYQSQPTRVQSPPYHPYPQPQSQPQQPQPQSQLQPQPTRVQSTPYQTQSTPYQTQSTPYQNHTQPSRVQSSYQNLHGILPPLMQQQMPQYYPTTETSRRETPYANYGRGRASSIYRSRNTGDTVYNNWSSRNEKTVRDWQDAVAKSSFLYDVILEKKKNWLESMSISILCVTAISSLFSLTQFGIPEDEYPWIAILFKLLLVITTITSTILSGIISIKGYENIIQKLSTYIQKLDNFFARVKSQLFLHSKIREDAIEFIKKENKDFTAIMIDVPEIDRSELDNADKVYNEFIRNNNNNIKQLQKYHNADEEGMDMEEGSIMHDEYGMYDMY